MEKAKSEGMDALKGARPTPTHYSSLYTVYKCESETSDNKVGHYHASDFGEMTLCGKEINSDWFISDNTFTGNVTCGQCLRILKERKNSLAIK